MPDGALAATIVVSLLGCLCLALTLCLRTLRRSQHEVRRLRGEAERRKASAAITPDEVIDLHFALQDVDDLRQLSRRATVVRRATD